MFSSASASGGGALLTIGLVVAAVVGCGRTAGSGADAGDGSASDLASAAAGWDADALDGADDGSDGFNATPGDLSTDSPVDGNSQDGSATAPFATIVRIVNDGASDYPLNYYPNSACPIGLTITGPASPIDQPTSIEAADTLCPCATCKRGATRSPICTTVDLICDALAPISIPSGGAYDFHWDGQVTIWRSDVSACDQMCSETFSVPTGPDYRFTLAPFSGLARGPVWHDDAPLPAPGGVVVIHVQ